MRDYKAEYQRKKLKYGSAELTAREIARRNKIDRNLYDAMFINQNNLCAICGNAETRKTATGNIAKLTIDHNHNNRKVRELLCHACNLGIGAFKENLDSMEAAILYLNAEEI